MRRDLRNIWEEIVYRGKHRCLICDRIVAGRERYGRHGNNNFGRTSHGKKHINEGTAWAAYGGADEVYFMPTFEEMEGALQAKKRAKEIEKELPKLRAERKPFITELRRLRKERDGFEDSIRAAIRKYGFSAAEFDGTFNSYCESVAERTRQIEEHSAELGVVDSKYDEDVVGSLTMGDDL